MTEGKNEAEDAKQIEEKIQQEADGGVYGALRFDMAAFEARQQTELDAARAAQKDDFIASCAALAEFGVARVEVEYDGYGDSGSVEGITFLDADDKSVELTEEQDMSVPCKVEGSRTWTPGKGDEEGKWNIEYKEEGLKSFFEECAYKWLPGGWEINEGSRGVVKIDVAKRAYSIDHGWREMTENYEEYSFDFSPEEASS